MPRSTEFSEVPGTIHNTRSAFLDRGKKFICKFCKVEVYSKSDPSAVLGKEHKPSCPRHRRGH